ncbi:hypothetical protein V2J09_019260 [Rumex salicifolius]
MFRLNRLIKHSSGRAKSIISSSQNPFENGASHLPLPSLSQAISVRYLDFYKLGSKEAIEKERARLADEMSRGYFADMSDLKKHGGKIAAANKVMIPAAMAVKFPGFEVSYADGNSVKLPIVVDGSEAPKATLLCLSFRASSQAMVNSWSVPFYEGHKNSKNVQLYEVSFIDSWFLTLAPVKRLLLRVMKKSNAADPNSAFQRQVVYSFGDHYYFRKDLNILNLLTGYMFLLDKFGRVRWQASGTATEDELSSLLWCTSLLLQEK